MELLELDTKVSIEGFAAALGIVGAAVGYLVNLINNWRNERRNRRYRGTKLLIVDLLEQHLWTGLTEHELIKQYESEALEQKRQEYGAWPPGRLNRIEFERELKQLQLDFMIDLVGKDHYQARVRPISSHDIKEAAEARTACLVQSKVTAQQLLSIATRVFKGDPEKNRYIRRDAIQLLLQLSNQETIDYLVDILNGSDDELALSAGSLLAPYVMRRSAS